MLTEPNTVLKSLFIAAVVGATACSGSESSDPHRAHLDPPPATQGLQLATPVFSVPVGEEIQDCYFFRMPADRVTWVKRFEISQNDGTHHMNLFRTNTRKALWGEAGEVVKGGECWKSANWSDWPLIMNSQESRTGEVNPKDPTSNGYFEWTLPEGVAQKFMPGELVMLQTHYVNVDSGNQATPLNEGQVFVNIWFEEESKVTAELGTLFATNQSIKICPGEEKSFESTCQIASADQGVTVVAANSHFHSRGKKFTISVYDPVSGTSAEPFYETQYWDDPPMARGMDIKVPAGGGLQYQCDFQVEPQECGDPANSCCFTFGGKVADQEHCNIFVYYYPKTRDRGCF